MKFQIKLDLIKDYLKRLSMSVQSVSSRVEFTGVLINVWDNSITFEGRNDYMDTKIEETSLTDVKIIETGRALIKANMLNEIIQKMDGQTVTFTKVDANVLTIEDADSNYNINLLSDENYEKAVIASDMTETITIPSAQFRNAISKTQFAGFEYHTKFIYQGLNLSIENGIMSTTTCDGIRIASHKSNIASEGKINKIIPLKVVRELIKILPSSQEYKFSFNHNKGVVVSGNMINQFSLIEGTFPVFDKFFVDDLYTKKLTIDKEIFESAIEKATILSSNKADSANRIGIKLSIDNFIIESREQEIGSAKIDVKGYDYSGDSIEISISPKVIHDGLKHIDSDQVQLLLTESQSSILLKADKKELVYLMSPMI